MRKFLAAMAVASLFVSASAAANGNLIVNGDFEASTTASNVAGSTYCYVNPSSPSAPECAVSAPGWTASYVLVETTSSAWGKPGAGHAELGNDVLGVQGTSTATQLVDLGSGGDFALTWSDANRTGWGGNETYEVVIGGIVEGMFTTTAGTGWTGHSIFFSDLDGGFTTVSFVGLTTTDATAFIDNVSLTVPEPAPASLLLPALGLTWLGKRQRDRRTT